MMGGGLLFGSERRKRRNNKKKKNRRQQEEVEQLEDDGAISSVSGDSLEDFDLGCTTNSSVGSGAISLRSTKSILRVRSLDDSLHRPGLHRRVSLASSVSFDSITIRDYDRVVGDNPSVTTGPPISIGWNFVQHQAVPVDVFEKKGPDALFSTSFSSSRSLSDLLDPRSTTSTTRMRQTKASSIRRRRSASELRMSKEDRWKILLKDWEVRRSDVAAAVRQTNRIKNQRKQTILNLPQEHLELQWENWKERVMQFTKVITRNKKSKRNKKKKKKKLPKDFMGDAIGHAQSGGLDKARHSRDLGLESLETTPCVDDDWEHNLSIGNETF